MILPKAEPEILACVQLGFRWLLPPALAIFLCMRHADERSKVAGCHVRGRGLGEPKIASENLPSSLFPYADAAPSLATNLNCFILLHSEPCISPKMFVRQYVRTSCVAGAVTYSNTTHTYQGILMAPFSRTSLNTCFIKRMRII